MVLLLRVPLQVLLKYKGGYIAMKKIHSPTFFPQITSHQHILVSFTNHQELSLITHHQEHFVQQSIYIVNNFSCIDESRVFTRYTKFNCIIFWYIFIYICSSTADDLFTIFNCGAFCERILAQFGKRGLLYHIVSFYSAKTSKCLQNYPILARFRMLKGGAPKLWSKSHMK